MKLKTLWLGLCLAAAPTVLWGKTLDGVNIELWARSEAISSERSVAVAADAGFDLVRLGVSLTPWHMQNPSARTRALEDLKRAVAAARARGMTVVVGLFALEGPKGFRQGQVVCARGPERETFETALADVVDLLPDDPQIALEPLNEPPTGCSKVGIGADSGEDWAEFQKTVYRKLLDRKKLTRFVAYAGGWGGLDSLLKWNPGEYAGDKRVLFTFHYYEPLIFTHQGVRFGSPYWKFVSDLAWPFSEPNWRRARASALGAARAASGDSQVAPKLADAFDEYEKLGQSTYMEGQLDDVLRWAQRYKIEPDRIFVGETGTARPGLSTSGPLLPGAAEYIHEVGGKAKSLGFRWAIWDLDGGFSVLCRGQALPVLCKDYERDR